MENKRFYLKDLSDKFSDSGAYFEYYNFDHIDFGTSHLKRPAMITVPGGGYAFVSVREGTPVALKFLIEGFSCFVMTYSVNKQYPIPQLETAFVVNYIYEHADEFNVIKEQINMVGFSAGGHLVGTYAYCYPKLAKILEVDEKHLRPYSVTLGYALLDLIEYGHDNTTQIITGGDPSLIEKLCVYKHVDKDYPPTVLFATRHDSVVNVINTELMDEALIKAGVKHKTLIFENGEHGGSLYTPGLFETNDFDFEYYQENRKWPDIVAKFIYSL